jgi:hypothetical protein
MESLPKPVVVESYVETAYPPPLPALRLYWDPEKTGTAERSWFLPRHLTLKGPAPERFGLSIVRGHGDSYSARLLWNDLYLHWTALTRVQLLTSALSPLLRVLGQDVWQLLNQPVPSDAPPIDKVA